MKPNSLEPLITQAREASHKSGRRQLQVLEELSGLAPAEFVSALGELLQYPTLSMDDLYRLTPDFDTLPYTESAQHGCAAFRDGEGKLLFVFGDPFADDLIAWAQARLSSGARWHLAHPADIAAYLSRHEDSLNALDGLLQSEEAGQGKRSGEDISLVAISESASPIVKLVHSTLYDALKLEASDIHLETSQTGLAIKYRIDGVLSQVGTVNERETADQVISRIKVMSELDISERRVPQDGRFRIQLRGREIDFRVSIIPGINRRGRGDPHSRQAGADRPSARTQAGLPGFRRTLDRGNAAAFPRPLRHAAGDRPDRQRQDHDAVRRDLGNQYRPGQDHHHRGSGGIPAAGRAADPGQREEGADLRARPAFHPAPRPGQDHGGRNPRPGNGADRGAVGA